MAVNVISQLKNQEKETNLPREVEEMSLEELKAGVMSFLLLSAFSNPQEFDQFTRRMDQILEKPQI